MEFSIKRKNIKWVVIALAVVAAVIISFCSIVHHKVVKKREVKALEEYVEKTIEREYEDLIRDYESYKETMTDYDYSRSFRWRYAVKINELVGYRVISSENDMYIDSDTDKEIRQFLKSKARKNAYEKILK